MLRPWPCANNETKPATTERVREAQKAYGFSTPASSYPLPTATVLGRNHAFFLNYLLINDFESQNTQLSRGVDNYVYTSFFSSDMHSAFSGSNLLWRFFM